MIKDKEIGKIYETKEYKKFHKYDWNRNISKNTMNKLKKSYEENGWKKEPIIINEEYGIIDGQHRFEFAQENDLPIYYMIIKGLTKEDCQIMNSVRTSWLVQDYIHFYAMQGNSSYIMLNSLNEMYDSFNLGIIMYAISNSAIGGSNQKTIANGDFKCTKKQYEDAIEVLDYLTTLKHSIKKIKGRKTQLCNAICWCYRNPKIDNTRLAMKLEENCNSFNPPVDIETALDEIERIYNYKIRKQNIVYIKTEWKRQKNNKERNDDV